MTTNAVRKRQRPGIQSVEIASRILGAMTAAAQPLQLKDLAKRCEMQTAKVHRYLVSLTRTDLVVQSADARYSIGPAGIALGLAGLHSVDVVEIASEALDELRDATGETAVLAIWSDRGPVVIRIEESSRPVFMNVRVGSTLPILRSAVGQVFAAFLPERETAGLIAKERRLLLESSRTGSARSIDDMFSRARRTGLGVVDGKLVPGVVAMAAPVFDHRARMVASIALLGSPEHLATHPTGSAALLLKRIAAAVSRRLGCATSIPEEPRGG